MSSQYNNQLKKKEQVTTITSNVNPVESNTNINRLSIVMQKCEQHLIPWKITTYLKTKCVIL